MVAVVVPTVFANAPIDVPSAERKSLSFITFILTFFVSYSPPLIVSGGKGLHDCCKKCKTGSDFENEIDNVEIHKELKKAREQAGFTLEKAAECIGISGASFSRMENGHSKVTMDRLEKLCALYEISASALVEGSIVTKPSTIDIDRLKLVVQTVQQVVNEQQANPSPEKMAMAVSELYRLEITHIVNDASAQFDPCRHLGIIQTIFGE
jgi:transcriptional regulator with XRE-family HTH domain